MSTDVYQSVNLERTPTDIPRDAQGAQATGSSSSPLTGAVGCKRDMLSQKMGPSGAETKLPLSLTAQVSEQKGGVLLRIQRKETCVGKTDLSDL